MRLIDADALEYHKQLECMGNGQYEDVKVVYECDIDNAPTIDAEPVKHGKWIEGELYIKCSECGYPVGHLSDNFCPNCGAKMERSEESENK